MWLRKLVKEMFVAEHFLTAPIAPLLSSLPFSSRCVAKKKKKRMLIQKESVEEV